MSRWRKRPFLAAARSSAGATEYFSSRERTVIMGSRIEI